ncbi:MAG: hypothetical protein IJO03_06270 [Clostridia bacterium]|nr:hypothetical protein [Clostridia bacterium]MBQ7121855.1 hypothetical protein [Clostridia bacterium]
MSKASKLRKQAELAQKPTVKQAFLNFIDAMTDNRNFCMAWLIAGFIFFTVYGFIDNPDLAKTASVIGKTHPRLFIWWAVFSGVSLYLNIHYLYKLNSFKTEKLAKFGNVCTILGFFCIFACVHIPSVEPEDGKPLQMAAHWSTALLFAAFFAAAIIAFLLHKSMQKSVKHIIMLVTLALTLILMVVLLLIFGKSGGIESIPMWVAYIIIFMLNFTKPFQPVKE